MKQAIWAGLALAGLNSLAAEPSLCTRLADAARRAPADTWAAPDPLTAWMTPAGAAAASPAAEALARDARWREALAASDAQPVGVQQLEGAPVYLLDSHAGTAHCQSVLLLEARAGQPVRRMPPPVRLDPRQLCMTQSAGFARVLGQPAFVVGGAPSMTSPDLHYRIAAWNGQGWAPACSLALQRGSALTAAERFCAPGQPACAAGQAVAQRLAQAYEADRAGRRPLDAGVVNDGRQPDAATAAALNPPLAEPGAIGDMNPPFPRFGADAARLDAMQASFSNADPRRLPVWVDGRWWLAVVGRAGVGWREGDATLVALFAPPGRAADGVASYRFRITPAGLLGMKAVDGAR